MKVTANSLWWIAGHEEDGLAWGLAADGGPMLRLYEELDRDLIDDIKDLNEDNPKKGWKAIRVKIEVIDP